MKKCASCDRDNPDDALICCYCGGRFAGESSSRKSEGGCRYCGHPVENWMVSCPNCLKDLPREGSGKPSFSWAGPSSSQVGVEPRAMVNFDTIHQTETTAREGSSRPLIAGVLIVGAGLADIASVVFSHVFVEKDLPDYPFDVTGLVNFCIAFIFLMGAIAVVAGVVAMKRGAFAVVIIGAVAGMLGVGPWCLGFVAGLAGLIVAAFSVDEFSG